MTITGEALRLETARVQRLYETVARWYDRAMGLGDRLLFGAGRAWVCVQARGAVLELAIGTGRNLAYYPPDVRITGIDLSPAMLAVAQQRAAALTLPVRLQVSDAQALPFPAACFDTVVCTLALSTIPDDRQALAEASRVLRPGGRLLLLDQGRSPHWLVQRIRQLLNPLAVRLLADHLTRDPLDHLGAAGFVIARVERAAWGIIERVVAHKAR